MTDLAFGIANWVSVGGEYATKASSSVHRKLITGSRKRQDERVKADALETPIPYLPPPCNLGKYIWRPLQTRHAFRLLILQPGERHQPLNCSLIEEDLDDYVDFSALSYCCGDPSNTRSILCEGQLVSITLSAYDALVRLRMLDLPLRIWLDSLCINQADLEERGKQVNLMRRIYRQAAPCFIWLGIHTGEDALAFKLLHVIDAFMQSERPDKDANDLFPERLTTKHPTSREQWHALNKLFGRPWFDRVWTLQESVLPHEILLVCGKFSISGSVFFGIVEYLHSLSLTPENLSGQTGFNKSLMISSLRRKRFKKTANTCDKDEDLFDTLCNARDRDATDPRDKVLGILGMCQADAAWTVTVGYEMSPEDIYYSVARHILEQPEPFRLLSACHPSTEASRLTTHLPSWVPDWSCRIPTPPCIQTYERETLYRAGSNEAMSFKILKWEEGHSMLSIKGKIVSCLATFVDKQSSTLEKSFLHTHRPHKSKREKFAEWYFYIAVGWVFTTAKEKRCPEMTLDQFFIATCWSATPKGCTRKTFWETLATSLLNSTTRGKAITFKPEDVITYANGYHQHDTTDDKQAAFLSNLETWTRERVFCVTSKGHIGWVPREARAGDHVCVFAGGKLPYVLRRCETSYRGSDFRNDGYTQYTIVGHCFFHGIMFGEVMADGGTPFTIINLR